MKKHPSKTLIFMMTGSGHTGRFDVEKVLPADEYSLGLMAKHVLQIQPLTSGKLRQHYLNQFHQWDKEKKFKKLHSTGLLFGLASVVSPLVESVDWTVLLVPLLLGAVMIPSFFTRDKKAEVLLERWRRQFISFGGDYKRTSEATGEEEEDLKVWLFW